MVARNVKWDDIAYELDAAAIWLLLQMRFDVPLRAFDSSALIHVAEGWNGASGEPVLALQPILASVLLVVGSRLVS